ncbi:hypothetical protein ACG98H_09465 [Corynebacterium sp. L4756]|uniref:hypothetical protein n=1 Tax=Corynebacterium sp. L4757 TaxID=3373098 RepID=UPI00374D7360
MKKIVSGLVAFAATMTVVSPAHAVSHEFVGENCRINLTMTEMQILNIYNPLLLAPDEVEEARVYQQEQHSEAEWRLENWSGEAVDENGIPVNGGIYEFDKEALEKYIQINDDFLNELEACGAGPTEEDDKEQAESVSSSSGEGAVIAALSGLMGVLAGVFLAQLPQIAKFLRI